MRKIVLIILAAIFMLLAGCSLLSVAEYRITKDEINARMMMENMKLGLKEDEVFELWGKGQIMPGFGGYYREYRDRQTRIGFPDDSDNDLYKSVASIETSNPHYALFGIRIGDMKSKAAEKLITEGFRRLEGEDFWYVSGEYTIVLRGEQERVESLQVLFEDKDLQDRYY